MNMIITLSDLRLAAPDDIVFDQTSALTRDVRVRKLFRARNAKQDDRGNVLVSHTFTVTQMHESPAAAASFLDDLALKVGRAFGTYSKQSGIGGRTVTLLDASATFQTQKAQGARTWVTYTVTGSLPPELE